jgi:hypothetical protein
MGVVINDFEIIAEAPSAVASQRPEDRPPPPAAGLRPIDLRDTLTHQARRAERLRAH